MRPPSCAGPFCRVEASGFFPATTSARTSSGARWFPCCAGLPIRNAGHPRGLPLTPAPTAGSAAAGRFLGGEVWGGKNRCGIAGFIAPVKSAVRAPNNARVELFFRTSQDSLRPVADGHRFSKQPFNVKSSWSQHAFSGSQLEWIPSTKDQFFL
jgi:hypothetical protein